jgi:hypothetical protein
MLSSMAVLLDIRLHCQTATYLLQAYVYKWPPARLCLLNHLALFFLLAPLHRQLAEGAHQLRHG